MLIVDDHTVVRSGLRALLQVPGVEVCGEAATGAEAVQRAPELLPDVVLMDVRMPDMDGLPAARLIKQQCPDVAVVIVTSLESQEYLREAIEAGAAGYLLKGMSRELLLSTLQSASDGGSMIDAEMLRQLVQRSPRPASPTGILDTLSERERNTLRLVARGHTNREIAAQLGYSVGTIKNVVHAAADREAGRLRPDAGGGGRRPRRAGGGLAPAAVSAGNPPATAGRGRRATGRRGAALRAALLLAALASLAAACGANGREGGGTSGARADERPPASPTPALGERSSLLLAALAGAAGEAYGRTAVTSPQPRDRFLRQIVQRSGVLEEARAAGLPLDLLVDSYVATAGAGGGGMELLDARDDAVAQSLAALLASGDTPSHRCASAAAPIAGAGGWLLTCAAIEPPATQLFVAVVAVGGAVIVAQEGAPRVDQVAATLVRELREGRLADAGRR